MIHLKCSIAVSGSVGSLPSTSRFSHTPNHINAIINSVALSLGNAFGRRGACPVGGSLLTREGRSNTFKLKTTRVPGIKNSVIL